MIQYTSSRQRWVVERTFSWLDNYRRLARNYERVCENATNMTITAEIYACCELSNIVSKYSMM